MTHVLTASVTSGDKKPIADDFNLLNTTNYVVGSIDENQYLAGPTPANPTAEYVENPSFGIYRATFDRREIQVGLRHHFLERFAVSSQRSAVGWSGEAGEWGS